MIDYEITKRTLKKNIYPSIWNNEKIASKGDIVGTFRYQPGLDLWMRIGKFDIVVWWWEIDDIFELEDTHLKPTRVKYTRRYEFGFRNIDSKQ